MQDDIHVVVDSLSCIAETEYIKNPRVHELKLITRHGDLEWYDGEKSIKEMVDLIEKTGQLPTTSQPPLGNVIELFTNLVKDGKKVLVISVDKVLSGTHDTFLMAAKQVMQENKGADIRVFNSYTASSPIAGLVIDLVKKIEDGCTMDEAEEWTKDAIRRTSSFFSVETLEYLQKGGRIGKLAGLLGSILGIRPLVHLGLDTNGELISVDKVRTRKKMLARIIELAEEEAPFERIYIANCEGKEDADNVQKILAEKFPNIPILSTSVGTVLATHLGPGAFGVFVRKKA
mgnify:CR=1 FL=1